MNSMVEKIVNLLFADVEENAETHDLREEIMNNCQERFADLTAHGYSEDEALDAVVESLRGMEEVLSPYRHKRAREEACGSGEQEMRFDLTGVERLHAELISYDLNIEESDSDELRLEVTGEGTERITMSREGSALVLTEKRFSDARTAKWDLPQDLGGLVQELGSLFNTLNRSTGSGTVTLFLPRDFLLDVEVNSASGDISWRQLRAKKLALSSSSGDIKVEEAEAERLYAKSNSGDVEADCSAEQIELNSMSGDITWEGKCERIKLRTVSGDVELRGEWAEAEMSTVSGDADIALDSRDARLIAAKSTSGDVRVRLPEGLAAELQLHTVSGDMKFNIDSSKGAALTVCAQTMSGDIRVR